MLKILAVGFDLSDALQKSLDGSVAPELTADEVRGGAPDVPTFAADGGTIRRRKITAFTVSLSSHCVATRRTDLALIVCVFDGEKRVDRAVAGGVRDELSAVAGTVFTVPVAQAIGYGGGEPTATPEMPGNGEQRRGGVEVLQVAPTIQVCGTCCKHIARAADTGGRRGTVVAPSRWPQSGTLQKNSLSGSLGRQA